MYPINNAMPVTIKKEINILDLSEYDLLIGRLRFRYSIHQTIKNSPNR